MLGPVGNRRRRGAHPPQFLGRGRRTSRAGWRGLKRAVLVGLYEAIHPWTLRHNTDQLAAKGLDFQDIVVDDLDEILWRLRSLCGLHNTLGSRILAVGGPGGWAQPSDVIAKLAKDRWKLDIQTVTYDDLGKLIQAARQDQAAVELARRRAEAYLKLPGTTLETKREFVDRAFLLEQVFRGLMRKADCRAITINGCMGTIMPISETTACLPLSTLNDDGYLAFCESDFVVIPSGILLGNISGRPPFLQDPTYPHQPQAHDIVRLSISWWPQTTESPCRRVRVTEANRTRLRMTHWPIVV